MYTDIGKGFAKTLTGPNNFVLNNAYLYCEAAGLTLGTFPGNIVGNVWQAKVTTDNGVIVYLVLRFTASGVLLTFLIQRVKESERANRRHSWLSPAMHGEFK